jgi:hypothetical protein
MISLLFLYFPAIFFRNDGREFKKLQTFHWSVVAILLKTTLVKPSPKRPMYSIF